MRVAPDALASRLQTAARTAPTATFLDLLNFHSKVNRCRLFPATPIYHRLERIVLRQLRELPPFYLCSIIYVLQRSNLHCEHLFSGVAAEIARRGTQELDDRVLANLAMGFSRATRHNHCGLFLYRQLAAEFLRRLDRGMGFADFAGFLAGYSRSSLVEPDVLQRCEDFALKALEEPAARRYTHIIAQTFFRNRRLCAVPRFVEQFDAYVLREWQAMRPQLLFKAMHNLWVWERFGPAHLRALDVKLRQAKTSVTALDLCDAFPAYLGCAARTLHRPAPGIELSAGLRTLCELTNVLYVNVHPAFYAQFLQHFDFLFELGRPETRAVIRNFKEIIKYNVRKSRVDAPTCDKLRALVRGWREERIRNIFLRVLG